jgi:hypothetical protein
VTACKLTQRLDLVTISLMISSPGVDLAAAEALQVRNRCTPMPTPCCVASRTVVHQMGIAGMEAGGDIGGTDQFHQFCIVGAVSAAIGQCSTHIAIDVDNRTGIFTPCNRPPRRARFPSSVCRLRGARH